MRMTTIKGTIMLKQSVEYLPTCCLPALRGIREGKAITVVSKVTVLKASKQANTKQPGVNALPNFELPPNQLKGQCKQFL